MWPDGKLVGQGAGSLDERDPGGALTRNAVSKQRTAIGMVMICGNQELRPITRRGGNS